MNETQTNKGIISIVIVTLSINATIGLCILGYCLLFNFKPDQILLTAFVAMVNYLLGVISGVLSKTSPTEATKQVSVETKPVVVDAAEPPKP